MLDLTNIGKLSIKVYRNEPFAFTVRAKNGISSLIGANGTMTIFKHGVNLPAVQNINISFVDDTSFSINANGLSFGVYDYKLEINTLTGDNYKIIDIINAI